MKVTPVSVVLAAIFCCVVAGAASIDVGVLDVEKIGGTGYGERGIMPLLAECEDFAPHWIYDLNAETLAECDVLVLANVHTTGTLAAGWDAALREYVEGGGGLVITHGCAGLTPEKIFPEICGGIEKHDGQQICGFSNHPITYGIMSFDTGFGDHRDLVPGEDATVVAQCPYGQATILAGKIGEGRIVRMGMCVGLNGLSEEEEPTGGEAQVMINALAWAAGTSPWYLEQYGDMAVCIEPVEKAVEQPAPVRAKVVVCARAAEIAAPVAIVMYNEAGEEVAAAEVTVEGQKQPGRGMYLRAETEVELTTEGLEDGKYVLMAEHDDVLPDEIGVELWGELMAADRERTAMARRILKNATVKFSFNQGYEYQKDITRVGPLMKAVKAAGFDTYDMQGNGPYWEEDDFALLETVAQAAAAEGLKVWATLWPPSGSEALRKMPQEEAEEYFFSAAERFAEISLKYPNLVAFTIDDFSHNYGFYTPEMMAEMAHRWQAVNPKLLFVPLVYYPGVSEEIVRTRGPYMDGIVFHYRAESHPQQYMDEYDPKSFEMYGDVMRHEFKQVRQIMGEKPVIAGLYIYYYQGGWGVDTPDGERPTIEHTVRDAVQKYEISHEFADGVRLYGLGIDHEANQAMGEMTKKWREAGNDWGQGDISDPDAEIRKYRSALDNPPYFGTLAHRGSALEGYLQKELGVPQIDMYWRLMEEKFDPEKAVADFFA